jgi:transposase
MPHTVVTLGIDISKASLDTFLLPAGDHGQYPNDAAGIAALATSLADKNIDHIVLEPSGGYERPVLTALQQAGLPVSMINARQIRDYARSKGILAKTDRLDAKVLADYAQTFRPAPAATSLPGHDRLRALLQRRRQVMGYLRQEKAAMEHIVHAELIDMANSHLRALEDQIEQMDGMIEAVIREDEKLARKDSILRSCKGVGAVLASTLLADMPELGTIDHRKAAALAGIAPRNHDSGAYRGQRHIGGGRASVRQALFMAALSASRFNPDIKAFYQKKRLEGKAHKQALIACAHKLLSTLNALLKENRLWLPKKHA